jgi:hypothetical protein
LATKNKEKDLERIIRRAIRLYEEEAETDIEDQIADLAVVGEEKGEEMVGVE